MSQEEKVGHLLKGVAEDVFSFLGTRDLTTVEAFQTETRKFESIWWNRIRIPAFERLPNVEPVAAIGSPSSDLASLIRTIVCQEVQAVLCGSEAPSLSMPDVQGMVKQEVRRFCSHDSTNTTAPRHPSLHVSYSEPSLSQASPTWFPAQYTPLPPQDPPVWPPPQQISVAFFPPTIPWSSTPTCPAHTEQKCKTILRIWPDL